jgi:hypothetical protein
MPFAFRIWLVVFFNVKPSKRRMPSKRRPPHPVARHSFAFPATINIHTGAHLEGSRSKKVAGPRKLQAYLGSLSTHSLC